MSRYARVLKTAVLAAGLLSLAVGVVPAAWAATATVTLLSSGPNPSYEGQNVTLTAEVTPSDATGSVEFFDGTTSLGTVTLASGRATLVLSTLAVGTHPLHAVYGGDESYSGSTSATVNQVVQAAGTVTITVSAPGETISPNHPTVTVPVDVSRADATPVMGFTVDFTVSSDMTVPGGGIEEGGFLGASGATTNFQVSNLGGGRYTASGVTFATPVCGSSALSGTLFTIQLTSSAASGPGTVTINSVTLRDCGNATLPSAVSGSPASVAIDHTAPTVAVTSPDGGETWVAGTAHDVTWDAADDVEVASVDLAYSTNGGGSWTDIVTGIANSGSRSWTIPSAPSASVLVRVTAHDVNGNSANDASDAVFTIKGTTAVGLASGTNPSVHGQSVTLTATVTPGVATGTVEFFDGATSLGTRALTGGSATLTTSDLSVATHSLTAVYGGDGLYQGSTSSALDQVVGQASTNTGLLFSPNPPVYGQTATITAAVVAVDPGAGVPTGSVAFWDDGTLLGTAPLSGGVATLAIATLAVGGHRLTAVYGGDVDFATSTSSERDQVVNKASTTTELASDLNPSRYGQSVTLTATVAVVAPGAGTPGGTVRFLEGETLLGSATLASGSAQLAVSSLSVASHTLHAVYDGDDSFEGSASGDVAQNVLSWTTTTTLASSVDPSVFRQPVTLTATVSPSTATGTVIFKDGVIGIGSATLSGGTASIAVSDLAVGDHALSVHYDGDTGYDASSSPELTQTVDQASTATTVASSLNPSRVGQEVTFTATVSAVAPGGGTPAGNVQFRIDGSPAGEPVALSGGMATYARSDLAAGSHTVAAEYLGSASHAGSSGTLSPAQQVDLNTTTTALEVGPASPSVHGQTLTLTATVGPSAATGTVTFKDGGTELGTGTLSGGVATYATSALAVGTGHSLTAAYGGDATYAASASSATPYSVDKAATHVAVASDHNPSVVGQEVTFSATVSAVAPGAGTPTGTVQFRIDGLPAGDPVALSDGAATYATSTLTAGSHGVTAEYSGDGDFEGASGSLPTQTVNLNATTTTVASSANPSAFGENVTFTATVTSPGGTPTGTVQFKIDGSNAGAPVPLSGGQATHSTATLAVGVHTVQADYLDNDTYASSSGTLSGGQTVTEAVTTVALATSGSPSVFEESVTLTATVSVTPPGAGTPTGNVEFFDGATSLGTVALSGGVATLATATLAVGSHSLTAVYAGDGSFATSTSAATTQVVQARIVATHGAHGTLTPSGTLLYDKDAMPSFAFAADSAWHVASVTVDGGAVALTSPYVFAALNANHTLDVQFAVNPPVAAITALAAAQQKTGNDGSGTTKIHVSWPAVGSGSTVAVYRAGYGNYPEYDDGPAPGSVPPPPAYPPGGRWELAGTVAAPGTGLDDTPGTRDYWYYVAFVTDQYGTHSGVSNLTAGTLDYHLGDVAAPTDSALIGDDLVGTSDVSRLGAHYGVTLASGDRYGYLDVGPTLDYSPDARPTTDDVLDFEDLVMFGMNYAVRSAPQSGAQRVAVDRDELRLETVGWVGAGEEVQVRLVLKSTGAVQALSARLAWDTAVVAPVRYVAGDLVGEAGGVVLSGRPGVVDAVVLGRGRSFVGEGLVATVTFRGLVAGEPKIHLVSVDGRSPQNGKVNLGLAERTVPVLPTVTQLAPAMPNPFRQSATLAFSLAQGGAVDLAIYSVDGRRVRTLVREVREPGEYRETWDGRDQQGHAVGAGIYYARLQAGPRGFTRPLVYLR